MEEMDLGFLSFCNVIIVVAHLAFLNATLLESDISLSLSLSLSLCVCVCVCVSVCVVLV